jgi:ElaB/YqjD/DUF883 family membrane-anchored ribosome-binding protein
MNPTRHNGDRRPDDIQADIERTRSEMHETLTALEHRLTPGQLVDQGIDYLRHSGGNEFVSNLGTQAKNNPLPLALTGIGLAWLMASGKNPPSQHAQTGPSTMQRLGERASSAMGSTSEGASSARQRIGESAQAARERAGRMTQSARETAGRIGESTRQQMDRARGSFEYMLREQPLALAAVGLAIGAVFAAVAPRTRQEDELMGDARDRLAEKAKETGKEQLQKAERVASAAKEAATEETRRQSPPAARTGAAPASRPPFQR